MPYPMRLSYISRMDKKNNKATENEKNVYASMATLKHVHKNARVTIAS